MKSEDFHTATWRRLKTHLEKRLEYFRCENDSLSLTPDKTAVIRGRIAELKEILELESLSSSLTDAPLDWAGSNREQLNDE